MILKTHRDDIPPPQAVIAAFIRRLSRMIRASANAEKNG